MDITPVISKDVNFINGYNHQGLKINNQLIVDDVILSANLLCKWENTKGLFEIESYSQLVAELKNQPLLNNIVLLIGTGHHYVPPSVNLLNFLAGYRIVPEVMLTLAAARTYNILVSEGRVVYAFLSASL